MTVAKRTFALKSLMTTTALSGALMAPAPALAADACGAPVNGVVTCSASGSPYQGIAYIADGADIVIEEDDIVTTHDGAYGIYYEGDETDPSVSVTVRADTIQTAGEVAAGAYLYAYSQSLDFDFGSIRTTGEDSQGLTVFNTGSISGRIDSVLTTGLGGRGVDVYGAGIDLEFGAIETQGVDAIGLIAGASGPLVIDGGSVKTAGDYSDGILISGLSGGLVALESVSTLGDEAQGVVAYVGLPLPALAPSQGTMTLAIQTISTEGEESTGIEIFNEGQVEAVFGTVSTLGEAADGIVLARGNGQTLLSADTVTTTGDDARGVVLGAGDASRMTAELGSVTTSGDFAAAVTTSFDGLSGNSDAIILKAGALTTSGDSSNGMYLYADDLTLDVETITTTGDSSAGAFLNAYGGDDETVALRGWIGAVQTTGAEASGVIVQSSGLFDLAIDSIHTRGAQATGFRSDSSSDVGGTLTLGSVLTEGEGAQGVTLYSELGSYDIEIQSLETRGDGSVGIEMTSWGDTTVALGTVRTSGQAAAAVRSWVHGDGAFSLTAQDVRTSGGGSTGIDVFAEGALTLALGAVEVTGSETDAVRAASSSGVTLTVGRGLSSVSGAAADLEGESIDVTLASTALVEGGAAGLLLAADSGSVIRNAGSISSANGFAIEAEAGRVTLENSGLVTGRIAFSSADDVINNSGRFAAALTSNFSAGDDVFNNTGVLSLADPTSTTPRTAFFNNLERLNNAGIIDLANGVAGDVFTVSGMVNGQTANSVILDLDLRGGTPTADRIVAGGFEGLNHIVLNLQGDASLEQTGIIIAESGMAQTGAEMDVRVAEGGFIGYGVTFADGAYRLDAKLALPAFEPTKVATGAQHQWTSGADVVSARLEQMRDEGGRAEGRGDQVWAQVYGGSNDIDATRAFDLMGESIDADLSHEAKSQGVQAGVDRAVPVEDGSLVFGMLAGAGKTELRFQNGDVTEYDGVGVGAYGHWFSGPLSIGVLAKLDTFKLDYDWAEANLKTRSNGFTVGARVDAAWRIAMGQGWYVEPQASLSWADTALGRLKARDGAEVVFGDTTSIVGRIGVRAGAEMTVGGLSFKPFVALHALNEFDGDNASTLLLAEQAVGVTDRAHGAWGRAVLGASLDAPSGLGGFIQAEGDFGEVEGFTARAGVKFRW